MAGAPTSPPATLSAVRERRALRFVAKALVKARRDVHPGLKGDGGVRDQIASQPSAGSGYPEDQGPGSGLHALAHAQPRKVQGERAIVVPELADAKLAAERGEAAGGLDAHRV